MADQDSLRPLPSIARALPGANLANLAPARSRTDPPARAEKTYLHKRLHSNTITGKVPYVGHRHRDRAKETVQSAIDLKPPISFEHLLRRDKKSPDSSRQDNIGQQQQRDDAELRAQRQAQAQREARLKVTAIDVERAKVQNEKREEELRQSLKHVEELGMSSTRQLDDTYYAILEKATILRSTVASLQQLAEESKRMRQHFDEDTQTLIEDTQKNIAAFGDFKEQEKTINELVEKLKGSKEETAKLNGRLEDARNRVEKFEKREKEKRSTRRKQWQATSGTLVGVLVLLIAVLILRHRRDVFQSLDVGKVVELAGDLAEGVKSNVQAKLQPKPSPSEDPYLQQLFDTL